MKYNTTIMKTNDQSFFYIQSQPENQASPSQHKCSTRLKQWFKRHRLKFEILGLILVFLIILFWNNIVITIHSGERGVYYRRFGGTVVDKPPLGEGLYIIWPFDRIHIYNIRQQQVQEEFNILAQDGLHIKFTVSIRFHPSRESTDLNYLHKYIGPDYVETVIIPEIEASLRFVVGKYHPEELYRAEYGMLDAALSEALLQLTERYIELDDLLITKITLPSLVEQAIEEKLREMHNAEKYQYLLMQAEEEAKRKVIMASGIRDFQDIVAEGISKQLLQWKGIEASLDLATSPNARVIVVGGPEDGLPLIMNSTKLGLQTSGIPYSSTMAQEILDSTDYFNIPTPSATDTFDQFNQPIEEELLEDNLNQ